LTEQKNEIKESTISRNLKKRGSGGAMPGQETNLERRTEKSNTDT
jgi:hypothetical protein